VTDPDHPTILRLQQLAAIGELGAGVTHETRNLLTAILGFAQLARQRPDPEAQRRYVEMIEREALRAVELLEGFLTFARIDTGETELLDVGGMIAQIVGVSTHQVAMRRIEIGSTIARDLPKIRGSRGSLTQVLLNVLINAMHATPDGGRIEIEARSTPAGLEIVISDSGEGVPVELRERIFEPFFTTKAAGSGTGLGLALCRRILSSTGGSIEYATAASGGASFIIRLQASPA